MSDRTSQFFDRHAADFDSIYGDRNRALDRVADRLFLSAMLLRYEKTLAGCDPVKGRTVIDVGCGPGHYSVALARAGAERVLGLDFAAGMLTIARARAEASGVASRCSFVLADFLSHAIYERFDYAVVMGFMDYVQEPQPVVDRVLGIMRRRAFFSFPMAGGLLAWQRKLRYRNRCDLFFYREEQLHHLLSATGASFSIESIGRDFFVTVGPRSSS